ncbi:MAG: hypothetical protein DME23_15020 [Verrucomicrobia bacterium]|nr:MAG: hypothetical protein DME23_15020 [Verrucomicrobiota bacterium]
MTNDKFRMTKEIRNLKSEAATSSASRISWSLMLRHSFDIRHSDFVIFQSHDSNAEFGVRSAESNN